MNNSEERIDAAIWDVWMLNQILTECRVYARPDPMLPRIGVEYPLEQNAVIHQVVNLMCQATTGKALHGMTPFPNYRDDVVDALKRRIFCPRRSR
jgi:hypothetical protein